MKRGGPIARKTPMPRGTSQLRRVGVARATGQGAVAASTRRPIKPRSAKRAAQEREYAQLRKEFLMLHPYCAWCGKRNATEVHHRRGRVGKLLIQPLYWSALCHDDHVRVTENPAWAYEVGLSESRLAKEAA